MSDWEPRCDRIQTSTNLGESKPVELLRVCTKVKQSRIWALFLFLFQNQSRDVGALEHVHHTDLFFLTTVKQTGSEFVPDLAELLPSLVVLICMATLATRAEVFASPATLHIYTGPGKRFHSSHLLLCVPTARLREQSSFNELLTKCWGWEWKAIYGAYSVLWPFLNAAVSTTCHRAFWWWELSYLFYG